MSRIGSLKALFSPLGGQKSNTSSITGDRRSNNASNNSGHNSISIGGNGRVTVKVKGDLKFYRDRPSSDLSSARTSQSSSTEENSEGPREQESSNTYIRSEWDQESTPQTASVPNVPMRTSRLFTSSIISNTDILAVKPVTTKNIQRHLPMKSVPSHVTSYLQTELFNSDHFIPLWEPSPSLDDDPQTWQYNIFVGDVGRFNAQGGFDTLFNIYQTSDENDARKLLPPPNFLPCDTFNGHGVIARKHHESTEGTARHKFIGFKQNSGGSEISTDLHLPSYRGAKVHCSAIYMHHGYYTVTMGSELTRSKAHQYMKEHHAEWVEHFGSTPESDRSESSLVLITACIRTSSWTSAAATKSSFGPNATLSLTQRQGRGKANNYIWSTNPQAIQTQNGPSTSHTQNLKSYFRDSASVLTARERAATEACHCVGVRASYIQEKLARTLSWRTGGTTINGSTRTLPGNSNRYTHHNQPLTVQSLPVLME